MFIETYAEPLDFNVDDFDFSDIDFLGEVEDDDTSQSTTAQFSRGTKGSKGVAKKSVHTKKVSPYRKGMTLRQALAEGAKKPNMSRRSPSNVLIAFPVFDRCDSLVYIPTTLARLTNSDDMVGLKKLLTTYMHKDCVFSFHINIGNVMDFNQKSFLQLMAVSNTLEPDRIMCVHSTKVVENKIRATVYVKLTDNQYLYDLMSRTKPVADPMVASLCLQDRAARLKLYVHDELLPENIKQELAAHSDSTKDLSMYMQCDIVLTFDDMTKKITRLEMTYLVTSIHPVNTPQLNDASS